VHLGDGEWVLVDSCLGAETGEPASLRYLIDLGIDVRKQVVLIVVTHWDDDHIRGIGTIATACDAASIACSSALRHEDILEFVLATEYVSGALGSGLDELRTILRVPNATRRIIWAKANLPLHPRPPGDAPQVVALSPSEEAFERSLRRLIQEATGEQVIRRRYSAPEGPNGASVVVSVRTPPDSVLLGADLERSDNPDSGWQAVVALAKPSTLASLVKVPHHASPGAHYDAMWEEMVASDSAAVLTPWALGARFLPTQADLDRLKLLSGRLFLTAMPALRRARKDREVNRLLERVHPGRQVRELHGWGHVRARRKEGETSWHVELAGDAVEL
jgi:hypothetical protein